MERLFVQGGRPLSGRIRISGAKNAALPLICASILSDDKVVLSDVPRLSDIENLLSLLEQIGVSYQMCGDQLTMRASGIRSTVASGAAASTLRASILVLGPLLARYGRANVALPGGCKIGARPIDLHLTGLAAMGADIVLEEGCVVASGELRGATIHLDFASVGATENLMMAAVLARGTTRIVNAAREPEISDLAHLLNAMGAQIGGAGTGEITIHGVSSLGGAHHRVLFDRIEAGTFALAAAATGGTLVLENARTAGLECLVEKLKLLGVQVSNAPDGIRIDARKPLKPAPNISTGPFPAFPTDLQAQYMALATRTPGETLITETIFENRFGHAIELQRMGADLTLQGSTVCVHHAAQLAGARMAAGDLRAAAGLVIAALAATGTSIIENPCYLDRGYDDFEEKLRKCGATIWRDSDLNELAPPWPARAVAA